MSNDIPLFSLAYTSVRPHAMPHVFDLWNSRSELNRHEWCVGIDEGCAEVEVAACILAEKHPAVKLITNTGAKTSTAGWNAAAAATTGKVIICVADDFVPPHRWDSLLLSLEPKGWEEGEYVVHTDDRYVRNIYVLSILTRKR